MNINPVKTFHITKIFSYRKRSPLTAYDMSLTYIKNKSGPRKES